MTEHTALAGQTPEWFRPPTPFESGNQAAMTHGADSPRMVEPVANELRVWLAEVAPWTQAAAFAPVASAWAWAEARARMVRAWVGERELVNDKGDVLPAALYLERLETRAANLRAELGLSPMSLAKLLGVLLSIDAPQAKEGLDALAAAGAVLVQAAREQGRLTSSQGQPVAELAEEVEGGGGDQGHQEGDGEVTAGDVCSHVPEGEPSPPGKPSTSSTTGTTL